METYQRFLLCTTVIPMVVLGIMARRLITKAHVISLVAVLVVVYAFTPFWDHEAIKRGFYAYDPERIWGLHVGFIPLEQFILYGTHTITLAFGLWLLVERRRRLAGKG